MQVLLQQVPTAPPTAHARPSVALLHVEEKQAKPVRP
jgi:hypothetical protein